MSLLSQVTQNGVMPGGNGRGVQFGTFKFNGADANGSLKLNLRWLDALLITPCGTPASDEQVSGPAIAGDGLVVPASGAVTITRTGAAKTAGLVCSYLAIGR